MRTTGFTHVSVHAHDLEELVRFYQGLFGMEEIPAPNFPFLCAGCASETCSSVKMFETWLRTVFASGNRSLMIGLSPSS